jgi:uncharacterized protein
MTGAAASLLLAMSQTCAWPATPPEGAFLRVEQGAAASELTASGSCGAATLCVRVDAAEMSAQWKRARGAATHRGTLKGFHTSRDGLGRAEPDLPRRELAARKRGSRAVVGRWPGGTCRVEDDETAAVIAAAIDAGYRRDVETWRRERERRLTADGGWLTVVGLHWLKPGRNRFGADAASDIVLPAHSAPPHAGSFVLESRRVTIDVGAGAAVTLAGKPVTKQTMRSDGGGATPDVVSLGALTMQIIERGDRLGVRLKDMRSQARRDFKGLQYFPIKPPLRISARFVPHAKPTMLSVPTVVGITETNPSPGYVTFEIDGKPLRLDPVVEPGSNQLFFIFRDKTAAKTTYGAGRFLYADMPKDDWVVLDFNKAYSPPCAFTAHATCPLPPEQNRLPVAVEAGEMLIGQPGH